ncbi:glycosyltransferase family 4 protein [Streptoalloteichus hindustanus]|uniref:2-deoxystreptamine N-acetyl-D-glucosaminyltransferase / 2-deoxystreptamine glucosyltransferase n=1 Tax=Streptoalloteichus hindustanus TaxID=2017 RepID=Q2MEX4_STRHI|nr:glycosyltransferase family 4 protein [Streptoalloteichus hindustanus]CAI47650.1 putative glycosyltransferase [Streptoalloteichus hindustanus]SHG39036.1 2-deoxystreptamine N-acetyl-D-glucosaminyltransferase / 2-deoxystreptamine glucosyltransferase [Streptoalloteichus hindustanus]
MRLRVLRLTPFFHHDCVDRWPAEFDAVGGMQVQILRLSRQLARRGVRQEVLTVGFPGLPRVREDSPGLVVRITRAPMPRLRSELTGLVGLNLAWFLGAMAECARRRRSRRPDLIQVHADGQLWALLAGPIASALLRRPYSLVLHCSRLGVYQPMSRYDQWQHRFVAAVERWALRRADGVCALTARTADVVRAALRPHAVRVDVVPDSVDPEPPVDAGVPVAERLRAAGLPADAKVVGYVGRVAHEKGWAHFVELAARLAADPPAEPVVFLVVGDGPQRPRMEERVAAAGLSDRFVFTGFLPNHEVPLTMSGIDVLVMPSVHEELGGSAIEAMVLGVPVVAYGVGGLRDTVGTVAPELLVPPQDVPALVRAVRDVLARGAEHRARVRAGRPWLEENFGDGVGVDRTVAHYRRVLAGRGGGGDLGPGVPGPGVPNPGALNPGVPGPGGAAPADPPDGGASAAGQRPPGSGP